jgi:hypothetical protein
MLSSSFIEDIFVEFSLLVALNKVTVQWHDQAPIDSFSSTISLGNDLTKSQSDYVLRILTKYKNISKDAGFDYSLLLVDPKWKKTFRVIDYSKKVHVEESSDLGPTVCLKFPYEFKKTFDQEFSELLATSSNRSWDAERKLRIIPLYDINLMKLYDFLNKHGFEMENSFLDIIAVVEEAWSQQDDIIPYATICENTVVIQNTTEDAEQWWDENKTDHLETDMMLAKSMGYIVKLETSPTTDLEKIVSKKENLFWIENNNKFFEIYKKIKTGAVCVILDRTSDTHSWIRNFVIESTLSGVDRTDIKVCFRETDLNKQNRFNEWIKEQGLGGSVDSGRIFIFDSKPAKWLFTKNIDVKLIVTNNLYPNTNTMTQQWIEHHPCVLYVGDIKPSQKRNIKIVQL